MPESDFGRVLADWVRLSVVYLNTRDSIMHAYRTYTKQLLDEVEYDIMKSVLSAEAEGWGR